MTQATVYGFTDSASKDWDYEPLTSVVAKYDEGRRVKDHGETIVVGDDKITFDFIVLKSQKEGQQDFFAYKLTVEKNVHKHNPSTPNCVTPSKCTECGEELSGVDPDNHTGNTELKDAVEAENHKPGYTGDLYCKDCKVLLKKGNVIPALLPDVTPSPEPTENPLPTQTPVPTETPKVTATPVPTAEPTPTATPVPTAEPTLTATPVPTAEPTPTATPVPTSAATAEPTVEPTAKPTAELNGGSGGIVRPEDTPMMGVEPTPGVTFNPSVTTAPESTSTPDVTSVPDTTSNPEATIAPETTSNPDVTPSVDSTPEPEGRPEQPDDEETGAKDDSGIKNDIPPQTGDKGYQGWVVIMVLSMACIIVLARRSKATE